MFEVDNYLHKKFHLRRYNCWHFAREIWEDITGERLYDFTPADINKGELQQAAMDARHRFVKVVADTLEPRVISLLRNPLLVLATTPCDSPHIGVLYQGKVLHLRLEGASYQPLDMFRVGFQDVRFYTTASRSL